MHAVPATVALLVLVGCGRFGFDPHGTGDASGGDSGGDSIAADAPADGPPIGLLLHFAFESDGLLHDRATGHDATCTACPVAVPGVRAATRAARFGGAACLVIPAPDFAPAAFTSALWTKQTDVRTSSLFGKALIGATTYDNSIEIYTLNTSSTLVYLLAGASTVQVSSAIGTWHHIAGVFEGGTLTGYVDGVLDNVTSGLPPVPYSPDPFRIGCDQNFGAEMSHFVGDLDDVRLYNRALSAAEIAALATP